MAGVVNKSSAVLGGQKLKDEIQRALIASDTLNVIGETVRFGYVVESYDAERDVRQIRVTLTYDAG